jgi:hypothetical protein
VPVNAAPAAPAARAGRPLFNIANVRFVSIVPQQLDLDTETSAALSRLEFKLGVAVQSGVFFFVGAPHTTSSTHHRTPNHIHHTP